MINKSLHPNQRGLSLLEVVVALSVFSIIIIVAMRVMVSGFSLQANSEYNLETFIADRSSRLLVRDLIRSSFSASAGMYGDENEIIFIGRRVDRDGPPAKTNIRMVAQNDKLLIYTQASSASLQEFRARSSNEANVFLTPVSYGQFSFFVEDQFGNGRWVNSLGWINELPTAILLEYRFTSGDQAPPLVIDLRRNWRST